MNEADDPVAHVPPGAGGKGGPHDIGAYGCTDAPHTVEPTHMAAGKMEGHIVVEGRVYAPGAQAVGNGPEAQGPKGMADGEAEECRRRHANADGRHPSSSQPPGQTVALQAGNHGAHGDDTEDHSGIGNRNAEVRIHGGPGRPQQGVRQAQTDKR